MNLRLRLCIIPLLVCLFGLKASATHIYGADFFYTHVIGNTYQVNLVIYADCGNNLTITALPTSTPQVQVYNGSILSQTINLLPFGTNDDVTPVCPNQANNTTCNGGVIQGIRRFKYAANISLSSLSANWRFHFTGTMSATTSAGRSSNITNLANGAAGASIISMDALLNNLYGPNSSPTFTTIPTPFYCLNVAQQYNQGAVDANNDSLAFGLTPGLEPSGLFVGYQFPYSATTPLATAAGSFSMNSLNGQMSFTPNQLQQSLVVNTVSEYRNGVRVGTASREMTFIILNSCTTNPPSGYIDSSSNTLSGVTPSGINTLTTCAGNHTISFSIPVVDSNNDIINVTLNGVPAGAVAAINNNNTISPSISFQWNLNNVAPGNYTFFATYKDNGCPLSGQQTQAYTIQVVQKYNLTALVLKPTGCLKQAYIQLAVTGAGAQDTIVIYKDATAFRTYTSISPLMADSFPAGNYSAHISSPGGCRGLFSFNVPDTGILAIPSMSDSIFYCKGAPAVRLAVDSVPGATITWYSATGSILSGGAPMPNTLVSGISLYYVEQAYKSCRSVRDSIKVYITANPVSGIQAPNEICARDTVTISFNGSVGVGPIIAYEWDWKGGNVVSSPFNGPWRVVYDTPGIKNLTLRVLENLCPGDTVAKTMLVKPKPNPKIGAGDICQADTTNILYAGELLQGTQYAWTFDNASYYSSASTAGPIRVHWPNAGEKRIFVTASLNGCSDTASDSITVYPNPTLSVTKLAETACYGDKIYLTASSNSAVTWTPANLVEQDVQGRLYAWVMTPNVFHVQAKNEYGCTKDDSMVFRAVEPCCTFSYPNAFSPNSDGRNDQYQVMTYGNTSSYYFCIYDRWGNRVFVAFSQNDTWDGTYKGKPCDAGTYFYYFRAHCMIGRDEERKGEIVLLR